MRHHEQRTGVSVDATGHLGGKVHVTVNMCQRGNRILQLLPKQLTWAYGNTGGDYQYDSYAVIIYIQLRYLLCHNQYLVSRLRPLENTAIPIKICLCYSDIPTEASEKLLTSVNVMCVQYGFTLLCCTTVEEAAEYIYHIKTSQSLNRENLLGQIRKDAAQHPLPRLRGILTLKEGQRLVQAVGAIGTLFCASTNELSLIPSVGETRSQRLHRIFNTPIHLPKLGCTPREIVTKKRPLEDEMVPTGEIMSRPKTNSFLESFDPHMDALWGEQMLRIEEGNEACRTNHLLGHSKMVAELRKVRKSEEDNV